MQRLQRSRKVYPSIWLFLLRSVQLDKIQTSRLEGALRIDHGTISMSKWKNLTVLITALVVLGLVGPAKSQQWPQKPVKIIVPYAAGGGSDTIARMFAQRFSEVFGKSFYVENKTGANGTIAAETVAHSQPDGYTLLMAVTPQIAIAPAMMKVQYDPVKDFAPISAVITNTFALVVN